ncbi:MAG TPA: autotransporter assembly complex family protein [Burkholderiales bacterium]|nr:autotransporter assembly complex family protein [Burkholderiales bacterium]
MPQEPRPIRFRVAIDAPRRFRKMLEEGLDLVRWQRDERVTLPVLERLVSEARRATIEALAAEGYFSPEVRTEIERRGEREAVVHLTVKPGVVTTVRGVDLQFQGPVLEDREGRRQIGVVKETWPLTPGEPFRQEQWEKAKDEALIRLGRGRYPAAAISASEARVDPEARRADLTLKMDSGPIFHAGPTQVAGLQRYPASVVENLNPFKPGEPYDAQKLDSYQRRLLESGYFNAVQFGIDPDPAQADSAPLKVTVVEAPSQRIDTGIAYSTDTRLGLTLDYTNSNIFDRAWRLRPRLNLNSKEQTFNTTLDTPPRPGGVWNTYSTKLERRDIAGQLTREVVVGYAHNWGLERTPSQVSLSSHFEQQNVAGSTTENNFAIFAGYRRTFRTTDDLVNPRRGLLGTFEVGASVPGLNTRDFGRVHAKVNWLIPYGIRNDFLIRGEAGAVLARDRIGIPSSFLFRTGGDQTLRGYAFETVGVPQGEAIVGGRYLALASVEYTRWFTDSIGGAVFVDAGDAFDRGADFSLATGYGVGLRWRSPVGPLRADIAYGERDGNIRLHFSVGFSF